MVIRASTGGPGPFWESPGREGAQQRDFRTRPLSGRGIRRGGAFRFDAAGPAPQLARALLDEVVPEGHPTRPPQAHGERVEGNSLPQANAGGPTHRWGLITSSGMAGDLDDVPSPEDVGRATWTLLHTIAAQMPDVLSFEQQRDASSLISSLARLYPCQSCAKDFQAIIQKTPPRLETKQELTDWLCDAHNVVNQKLGKKHLIVASLNFDGLVSAAMKRRERTGRQSDVVD
eukprot:CAMPEP_0114502026 /NCGR_PEP_ID=MMETSP0109-20121206/8821_1 /TAXON_ID=29199 /ORGANISM="Chlorarachnion reptans, Strain CCCM449" /LENGTH=230 /DNA_ID=CAMNT_0001679813 /DNA_START=133 /DNA_END=826 /DNA_ORIENTATION=-